MESKEIILIICTLITVISSVMWEVNNGPAKIMRALHLGIGLILSVCCLGVFKGTEIPFMVYPALIASGIVSLIMLMSKGQSLFAIIVRLAHFVNLVCAFFYFYP